MFVNCPKISPIVFLTIGVSLAGFLGIVIGMQKMVGFFVQPIQRLGN